MSETTARAQAAGSRDFVAERVFDAPRERLWAAWTQQDQLAQWFGPAGVRVMSSKLDLRPGGIFHSCLLAPDGKEMWAGRSINWRLT